MVGRSQILDNLQQQSLNLHPNTHRPMIISSLHSRRVINDAMYNDIEYDIDYIDNLMVGYMKKQSNLIKVQSHYFLGKYIIWSSPRTITDTGRFFN